MTRLLRSFALVLLAAGAVSLPAQTRVRVRLLDGGRREGVLAGVSKGGGLLLRSGGGVLELAPDRIMTVQVGEGGRRVPGRGVLVELVSGDALYARIESGRLDEVTLSAPAVGVFKVSLDAIRQVVVADQPGIVRRLPADPPREDDELYLRAGERLDRIRGGIVRLDRSGVVFDTPSEEGRRFLFQKDGLVAIRLALLESFTPPSGIRVLARFRDGSHVSGRLLPGEDALQMELTVGARVTLNERLLERLEFLNPAFAFLSDLTPVAVEETPLLEGGRTFGILRDVGFEGQPWLRIGDELFSRGIGARARTRITYALHGACDSLQASIGADPLTRDGPVPGTVRVRVFVDGEQAFESGVLVAGAAPRRITVDGLKGHERLTVEVDFGATFSIGARGVLGDAVLLKSGG